MSANQRSNVKMTHHQFNQGFHRIPTSIGSYKVQCCRYNVWLKWCSPYVTFVAEKRMYVVHTPMRFSSSILIIIIICVDRVACAISWNVLAHQFHVVIHPIVLWDGMVTVYFSFYLSSYSDSVTSFEFN